MTAAASANVRPTIVIRADQFERGANGLASSSLTRAWASAPRTSTASADERRKWDEERQKAEEERERQARATDESMRQTYEMIYAK
jgi:aspartate oxidase